MGDNMNAWKGLMGTRCWGKRGKEVVVRVHEIDWRVATGDGRGYAWASGNGNGYLFDAIARPPPSTTYDGCPIIQKTLCERVWKSQSSNFYWLTTEWYLMICDGGCWTLGTSGGARVPKTKLDQSWPYLRIVSQWEPVKYLSRRAPGSQPIKE